MVALRTRVSDCEQEIEKMHAKQFIQEMQQEKKARLKYKTEERNKKLAKDKEDIEKRK